MNPWYKSSTEGNTGKEESVVIELGIHDPAAWKRRALERASVDVSDAIARCMERLRSQLTITMDEEDDAFIRTADLAFLVDEKRAERFRNLLAQPLKQRQNKKTGEVATLWYTNSYRLISCEPANEDGTRFRAVTRLALGAWKVREPKKENEAATRKHELDLIPVKMLGSVIHYALKDLIEPLPRLMRDNVCRQAAHDLVTYLACVESDKVRGETSFPSTEDRNPERRRRSYELAIDALVHDLTPIRRVTLREAVPGTYAADDPKGDKRIIQDERWTEVMKSPFPKLAPLMFLCGDGIRLIQGVTAFDAGTSKANRHRGCMHVSPYVRANRPERVRKHGISELRQWYAAVPLSEYAERPPESERKRGLNLHFRSAPIQGDEPYVERNGHLLLLLSQKDAHAFRTLRRRDLHIAQSQLLQKKGSWFLQLTLRLRTPAVRDPKRVLGISFGLDAIASWSLLSVKGKALKQGALSPNAQILSFLARKAEMEWDQKKGRWVGGRRFAGELERIAHDVANSLLALAEEHDAALAVEDVSYVQKAGPDHQQNLLFSAWNFGQLTKILEYKSKIAGRLNFYASDYVTKFTCPACGAIGNAKEPPAKRKTWRNENGELECRKCGRTAPVLPHDRAAHAARHGIKLIQDRNKRAKKRAG